MKDPNPTSLTRGARSRARRVFFHLAVVAIAAASGCDSNEGGTGVLGPAYALTVTVAHVDDAACAPSTEPNEGMTLSFVTPQGSTGLRAVLSSKPGLRGGFEPQMVDGIEVVRSGDSFALARSGSSADAGTGGPLARGGVWLDPVGAEFVFASASLRGIDANHDGRVDRLEGEMTGNLVFPQMGVAGSTAPPTGGCVTQATLSVEGAPQEQTFEGQWWMGLTTAGGASAYRGIDPAQPVDVFFGDGLAFGFGAPVLPVDALWLQAGNVTVPMVANSRFGLGLHDVWADAFGPTPTELTLFPWDTPITLESSTPLLDASQLPVAVPALRTIAAPSLVSDPTFETESSSALANGALCAGTIEGSQSICTTLPTSSALLRVPVPAGATQLAFDARIRTGVDAATTLASFDPTGFGICVLLAAAPGAPVTCSYTLPPSGTTFTIENAAPGGQYVTSDVVATTIPLPAGVTSEVVVDFLVPGFAPCPCLPSRTYVSRGTGTFPIDELEIDRLRAE